MEITSGRGRNRQSFNLGSFHARTREESEKLAWNVKKILFNRGVINSLK